MANKCVAILRQKGNFIDKQKNQNVEFDNYVFYLDSGDRMYTHESVVAGLGKPQQIKIKVSEFNKVYSDDPKLLYGKELHFYQENGQLARIEVK